jgi:hypothetical protein
MEVSQSNSAGLKRVLQVKAAPGTLYSLLGFSTAASAQYIQLHDSAATPAPGAVPVAVFKAAADQSFYFDYFADLGRRFSSGICVVNSSTAATYTAGAEDCLFDALYI